MPSIIKTSTGCWSADDDAVEYWHGFCVNDSIIIYARRTIA